MFNAVLFRNWVNIWVGIVLNEREIPDDIFIFFSCVAIGGYVAIEWKEYSSVVFLDSNIALECLALDQLPWFEIIRTGNLLLLVTPTVMQEVDSKKNHSRLGDHARRFNKLLRPLLIDSHYVIVRESPAPSVHLALADCGPVDWTSLPEFDSAEPDARVVAQAYFTRGPTADCRVVISNDIRPLYLAKKIGMRVLQVGDNWLRPKEVSEADKKVAALQRELKIIKNREPVLQILFDELPLSVETYRLVELSIEERENIEKKIIELNPMPLNGTSFAGLSPSVTHDGTLADRYEKWRNNIIPNFVQKFERKLELNFGQVKIRLKLKNIGQVPAENALLRISVQGGWINDQYVIASPTGPHAPRRRDVSWNLMRGIHAPKQQINNPDPHQFFAVQKPRQSSQSQIRCEDFRHGYDYEYTFIAWVDPYSDGVQVDVNFTASNLHGEFHESVQIQPNVKQVPVSKIVDLATLKFIESPPALNLLLEASKENSYHEFLIDGSDWDD